MTFRRITRNEEIFLPLALFVVAASAPQAQTPRTSRVVNPKANEIGAAKPGTVFRDCPDCPEMVVLPAGSFTMGSSAEEKSWAASHGGSMHAVADEAPQLRSQSTKTNELLMMNSF